MRKIIFLISFLASLIVYPQDGSLDLSFNPPLGVTDIVTNVLLQSDGKILVLGEFQINSSNEKIIRLNVDGTLDATFNSTFTSYNYPNLGVIQPDGKILVIENNYNSGTGSVIRLNSDGSKDESFKSFTATNSFSSYYPMIEVIVLLPDGKIMIGGRLNLFNGIGVNHIARLNSDGALDTSFNFEIPLYGSGYLTTVNNIKLLPEGKILMELAFSGAWGDDYYLIRLNSDWTSDSSFFYRYNCYPSQPELQSNSKIIQFDTCTIWDWDEAPYEMLFRLNSDGIYDNSFHRGGVDGGLVSVFKVQSDDKIIIIGYFTSYDGIAKTHIARLNSDGTIDTTFDGGNGMNIINSGFNYPFFNAIFQPDGKIIIIGDFTGYNGVTRNHIARINTTRLSLNEALIGTVQIYPNPVKDILNLSLSDVVSVKEYEIYDLQGKRVIGDKLNSNSINVSNLSKGVYMLKINTSNGHFSNKFLKE